MDYRGHFGTILPQAQSLVNAAQLRGDLASAELSEHQLEWVIGRNPFSQSTMYGEGYDFPPLYTPSSGDIVGALPVGIQTLEDNDIPYWPVQANWTYKEIWVHPVARWIWLMRDLSGPALIQGQASTPVEFKELTSGQVIVVEPDQATGRFRAMLPEGKYSLRCNREEQVLTFLPSSTYHLDLRPERIFHFEISKLTTGKGKVMIKIKAWGKGNHHFSIRADNLEINNTQKELKLKPGQTGELEWRVSINSQDTPWFAVVIPDDDISQRKEIMGAAW
jgi:hypothetical protein